MNKAKYHQIYKIIILYNLNSDLIITIILLITSLDKVVIIITILLCYTTTTITIICYYTIIITIFILVVICHGISIYYYFFCVYFPLIHFVHSFGPAHKKTPMVYRGSLFLYGLIITVLIFKHHHPSLF